GFALGLVSIFIPIFIAQQGFSPFTVFSYVLMDVGAFAVVSLPVGKMISRYGKEICLVSSSLLYVLVFIILQTSKLNVFLIYTVGFLTGLAAALHWIPVNTEFTVGSEKKDRGESYGKLEGIPKLISPLAPLLGAAVMTYLGFNFLVTFSLLFAVSSIIPLIFGEENEKPEFRLEGLTSLDNLDLWVLYFLDGFATTAYVFILPLFIYYVIGGTLNVGSAKTLMAVGAGLFSITAGKISDLFDHEKLLLAGALAAGVVYLFVPGLESKFVAFILSFVAGLTYTVYTVPLVSIVADIAEKQSVLGFFSVREVFQSLGKVSVVLVLLYFLSSGSMAEGFKFTFYLSSVAVVLIAVVGRTVKESRGL
ncbi:MAG: MFS transporter, partial [Candidatus Nanohalobium sp.]